VPAYADHVDARMLQRRYVLSEPLRGINVEKNRVIANSIRNRRQRLQDSGLIIRMHNADQPRVWAQSILHRLRIDPSARLGIDKCYFEALLLQSGDRFQDGMMLDARGNDVTAFGRPAQSQDCKIVAFRGATGEKNIATRCLYDCGNAIASLLYAFTGPATVFVRAASRIAEVLLYVAQNFIEDARIDGSRGGAIEIRSHACSVAHYCMGIMDSSSHFLW
jgi:hypothetical protein